MHGRLGRKGRGGDAQATGGLRARTLSVRLVSRRVRRPACSMRHAAGPLSGAWPSAAMSPRGWHGSRHSSTKGRLPLNFRGCCRGGAASGAMAPCLAERRAAGAAVRVARATGRPARVAWRPARRGDGGPRPCSPGLCASAGPGGPRGSHLQPNTWIRVEDQRSLRSSRRCCAAFGGGGGGGGWCSRVFACARLCSRCRTLRSAFAGRQRSSACGFDGTQNSLRDKVHRISQFKVRAQIDSCFQGIYTY